jgi:hypothetical protein
MLKRQLCTISNPVHREVSLNKIPERTMRRCTLLKNPFSRYMPTSRVASRRWGTGRIAMSRCRLLVVHCDYKAEDATAAGSEHMRNPGERSFFF